MRRPCLSPDVKWESERQGGIEIQEPVHIVDQFRDGMVIGWHWHVERRKALEAAGLPE